MTASDADDSATGRSYQLWRLYDAGGPTLRLKVRYRDETEVPDWQHGPDVLEALAAAAVDGWHEFDREPGGWLGEYAIIHLVREGRTDLAGG